LRQYEIWSDCELRQYITETLSIEFKRGHTYYEFTNKKENILEGTEVLLQNERNKWFRLVQPKENAKRDVKKFYGEGITGNSFGDQYRVFIQSFGSGTRYLPSGTSILYNKSKDQV
jgi:hypothetical protein